MTAKFGSGSNSPFDGSVSNAQLAAEIGRCLQSRYAVPFKEPLPEKLTALVQRLREQGGYFSQSRANQRPRRLPLSRERTIVTVREEIAMPRSAAMRQRVPDLDQDDHYPDDLLPDLQRTLAVLADAELRYEAARERLEHEPPGIREPFLVEIEARYRRERQPYVQRLEQLRGRIRVLIVPGL